MGGYQNYDPFMGTLRIRCLIIIWIPKGTIILTTTHTSSAPGAARSQGTPVKGLKRWHEGSWGLGFKGLGFRV